MALLTMPSELPMYIRVNRLIKRAAEDAERWTDNDKSVGGHLQDHLLKRARDLPVGNLSNGCQISIILERLPLPPLFTCCRPYNAPALGSALKEVREAPFRGLHSTEHRLRALGLILDSLADLEEGLDG